MAKSKIILYKSKLLKNGNHPIMLRIINEGKLKYFSLGYSCKPEFWDAAASELRNGYPNARKINLLLSKKKNQLEDVILDFQSEEKDFSNNDIEKKFRGKIDKKTVPKYLDELIKRFEKTGKVGNATVYRDLLRTIKLFHTSGDLSFSDINYLWLTRFEENFLANELQETSISLYMRTLRATFNKAILEGYCKQSSYPFKTFKISKYNTETRKRAISKEEMLRIINEPLEEQSRLWHSRNYFLFSFYCVGMNLTDMCYFPWSGIINGRICYKRRKTGKEFNIKIQDRAQEILNYYSKNKTDESDYVFPFLNDSIHKTPQSKKDRIKKITKMINKDIKDIAQKVNIKNPEKISFYVARHSWGNIQKSNGTPKSIISESYGHSDEKTTDIYLNSFANPVLDEANSNLI